MMMVVKMLITIIIVVTSLFPVALFPSAVVIHQLHTHTRAHTHTRTHTHMHAHNHIHGNKVKIPQYVFMYLP